jgi:phospholipase/lecithinase/hemolysin
MQKFVLSVRLVYLLLIVCLIFPAVTKASSSWYVFGDSLSDNGNIPKLTDHNLPPAPYFNGRFSNGPVWAEYVPLLLHLNFKPANDYAVGGAFTGPIILAGSIYNNLENTPLSTFKNPKTKKPINLAPLPSFLTEIQNFTKLNKRFAPDDIIGIWIGANDFFAAKSQINLYPKKARQIVQNTAINAVFNVNKGIYMLYKIGAKQIVILTLPPLRVAPALIQEERTSPKIVALADNYTHLFNSYLEQSLYKVRKETHVNIVVVHIGKLYAKLLSNPKKYGFSNITGECIRSANPYTCKGYLFFDGVHPTTYAQKLIAQDVSNVIQKHFIVESQSSISLAR